MKKLLAAVVLIFVAIPWTALAQPSSQTGQTRGAFVPLITPITHTRAHGSCNSQLLANGCFQDPCNTCDIIALAHNVLQSLIALAVILAVILFIYAGWIYLTTAIQDRIQKAHRMFWQVFVGLVVVLTAWLIVDTGLRVLARDPGTGVFPWSEFLCDGQAEANPCVGSGFQGGRDSPLPQPDQPDGPPPTPPSTAGELPLNHQAAMDTLNAPVCGAAGAPICVTSTAGPGGVQSTCTTGTGCTTLNGLRQGTAVATNGLAAGCRAAMGQGNCNIQVVGGTEPGHADGTHSHGAGYKIDIDDNNQTFNQYMDGLVAGKQIGTTGVGPRYALPQPDGTTINVIRESDHWDIQYCPAGVTCDAA